MKKLKKGKFHFLQKPENFDENKKSIVFIHGASINSYFFINQLNFFSDEFNVFAPDLPGRNRGDEKPCSSVSKYADFIIGFIEEMNLEKPHICGISMGGAIVLDILARPYENIENAVIINSGARLKVLDMVFDSVRNAFEDFKKGMIKFGVSKNFDTSRIEPDAYRACVDNPMTALADFTACNNFDLMNSLGKIEKKVLILGASDDVSTPLKYGKFLEENIKDSKFVIIDGCGHLSPMEKPEEVNSVIYDFLKF
ncbi:MAG: alpha/beta hydrolase [Desulfobacteraceae bacterium]|nr:alpha/beta hydrolase [Desulfobacteraceae bacterium]MCB9495077.1 alpha/beta hydrolase [Desulfobacteraceae bacterium]